MYRRAVRGRSSDWAIAGGRSSRFLRGHSSSSPLLHLYGPSRVSSSSDGQQRRYTSHDSPSPPMMDINQVMTATAVALLAIGFIYAEYHRGQRDELKEQRRKERKETRQKFYDATLERIRGKPSNSDQQQESDQRQEELVSPVPEKKEGEHEEKVEPRVDASSASEENRSNASARAEKAKAVKDRIKGFLHKDEARQKEQDKP